MFTSCYQGGANFRIELHLVVGGLTLLGEGCHSQDAGTHTVRSSLGTKANEVIGRTSANVVARAARFLLLADSRASFEIEGEKPPRDGLERLGRAVLQAGRLCCKVVVAA